MKPAQVIMAWHPIREMTEWEEKCIVRAKELFDIRWLNCNDYDMPRWAFDKPQGPSEQARYYELQKPYTLWTDCDVYWYKVPELGKQFLCDATNRANRTAWQMANDAVVWSGAHPEIAIDLWNVLQKHRQFKWAFKLLRQTLAQQASDQGVTWNVFDPSDGYYQHKQGSIKPKGGLTKTCNRCGLISDIPLSQRTYACECGYVEDRDINAAKNLRNLYPGLRGNTNACGHGSSGFGATQGETAVAEAGISVCAHKSTHRK